VSFIKNLLALIGLLALVAIGFIYFKINSVDPAIRQEVSDIASHVDLKALMAIQPETAKTYLALANKVAAIEGIEKIDPEVRQKFENLIKEFDPKQLAEFDPEAPRIYLDFAEKMLTTKDPGDAMVWAVPVTEGITVEEVKESLKSLAVQRNFLFVGESPFYKQVEAVTGEAFRHVSFLNFCDVQVGMKMLEYNNAYSAFMPCTISVVEDQEGKIWLYAMNLDFLIHGGKQLPTDLMEGAAKVRTTMLPEMMQKAANGEF